MRVLSSLVVFVGLSTATSILTADRPFKVDETAASIPEGAPADYQTDIINLTKSESSKAVVHLSKGQSQRRNALRTRDPITAQDFFECATSGNPPAASDCNAVISTVRSTDQALVIAPGACLLFQFNTCWGFFCSLCDRLGTDTDFIGSQLDSAQTLCVSGGSAGTIVGEDAPQWEAGFIRANGQLPNYQADVC
ncbi:hypothetical protein F4808DRAFT_64795 [Astrocystis sublimbata]|nr:hypothetical protein F4808DRAFT_64795 [Astrocystis sublimbata]